MNTWVKILRAMPSTKSKTKDRAMGTSQALVEKNRHQFQTSLEMAKISLPSKLQVLQPALISRLLEKRLRSQMTRSISDNSKVSMTDCSKISNISSLKNTNSWKSNTSLIIKITIKSMWMKSKQTLMSLLPLLMKRNNNVLILKNQKIKTLVLFRDLLKWEGDFSTIEFASSSGNHMLKEEEKRRELLLTVETPFTETILPGISEAGEIFLMSGVRKESTEKR